MALTDLIGSPQSRYGNVELGIVPSPPDGLEYLDLRPSFDAQHVTNVVQTQTSDGQAFPTTGQLSLDPGSGGSAGQVADATSVQEFFAQTVQRSPLLSSSSTSELFRQAYYLIGLQKNPKYRFDQMSVQPVDNPNLWVQAVGREISDRVTIKRYPANQVTGGSGNLIRKDAFVEQVQWQMMGLPEEWTITFQLSPAGAPDDYPNDKTTPTWARFGGRAFESDGVTPFNHSYSLFTAGNCFTY